MRTHLLALSGLLVSATALLLPAEEEESISPLLDPPTIDAVCATGCSAVADEGGLSLGEYRELLADFDGGEGADAAFEALLFHGARTRALIADHGLDSLTPERADVLQRELSRTHARLSVRLVDDEGYEYLRLDDARVPLDIKQHLSPDQTFDTQPPEVSGTVRRVGAEHLWVRL